MDFAPDGSFAAAGCYCLGGAAIAAAGQLPWKGNGHKTTMEQQRTKDEYSNHNIVCRNLTLGSGRESF
ncbi:MAG: hypothetical protein ACK578_03180, partial [Pirellula sp.]